MALLVVGVVASIGFSVYLLLRVWDVEGLLHTAEHLRRLHLEEDQARFENILKMIAALRQPEKPTRIGRAARKSAKK